MSFEFVRTAYGARVSEYVEVVGSIDHVALPDLVLVERWARGIEGAILDVGCGPGQWTHHLSALGLDAEGVDPVPEFIEHARRTYPTGRYRLGRAESLEVVDDSIGGVLAWYSLIHTDPEQIGAALREFARCLRKGGGLALGFFVGPHLGEFDHAITTAYQWPIASLTDEVEAAGFTVAHTESRAGRPGRTHGAILATKV